MWFGFANMALSTRIGAEPVLSAEREQTVVKYFIARWWQASQSYWANHYVDINSVALYLTRTHGIP